MSTVLKVKKLHPDAIIPQRGTPRSSGLDLSALEKSFILPGQTKLIKTGIAFDIPEGYEVQVRPRSGLSLKTSLRLANSVGTVDQDYQGDVSVLLWNSGDSVVIVQAGERVAQAVLCPVVLPEVLEVSELSSETLRGSNGFGSTGV